MSHKSRAITVALALAVGLGLPASVAMAPTTVSEPTPTVSDIELIPVSEPLPECEHEDSPNCVWVADERGNGVGSSFSSDESGNINELDHNVARDLVAEPTPAPEPSAEPDLTDTRDPELWEAESAPWEWSQLLPDEAYIWPRCDDFYQTDCVWVASEHKVQGAAESFLALSDGSTIPLSESQALVMVGG